MKFKEQRVIIKLQYYLDIMNANYKSSILPDDEIPLNDIENNQQ